MEEKFSEELNQLQTISNMVIEFLVNYSFQAIGAIIILIIGFMLARKASRLFVEQLEKRDVDVTLRTYAGHIVNIIILFCFIVIALGKFGITIAPFVAALGALTVVAGFALQGLVANYAAGVSIIATRPFKVGDTITVINVSGLVKEIKLATTIVETEDQEEITIPNKHIIGEVLLNTFEYRLVEASIGIAYSDNPQLAVDKILAALKELDFVTQQPDPQVGIDQFADSAIVIGVRAWVPTTNYMECRYQINKKIFDAVTQAGLNIPFPQLDIHNK